MPVNSKATNEFTISLQLPYKSSADDDAYSFAPDTLKNIYYKKRLAEYELSNIYRTIKGIDKPELKEYDQAIEILRKATPEERTNLKNGKGPTKNDTSNNNLNQENYQKYAKIIKDNYEIENKYSQSILRISDKILPAFRGYEGSQNYGAGCQATFEVNQYYAEPEEYS